MFQKSYSRCSSYRQYSGFIFLLVVLVTIIVSSYKVIVWFKDVYYFPLFQLVITGRCYYTTNDDIYQSVLILGGSTGTFMTQDVNMIQQRIKRLPWIKQASVRKQWPNKLTIHLVEYVPVARWNDFYMLDNSGKIFSVPKQYIDKQSLLMLYGPENSEQDVLAGYYALNKTLSSSEFQLKAVSMSARHSWKVMLQDNIRLELGRDDKINRLQRFIKIYPVLLQHTMIDRKRISYIDLRYNSGFAVGWAPGFIGQENNNY